MLRLLETLTLISTRQNQQMEKIKTSMASTLKGKPSNFLPLGNQLNQKNSKTQDQVEALSIKVDQCIDSIEEIKKPVEESRSHRYGYSTKVIRPLLQVVDGFVNVTQRLAMSLSRKPSLSSQQPSKVHLKPLMGHIDALSKSIHRDATGPKVTKVTKDSLKALQKRIKASVEVLRQWKNRIQGSTSAPNSIRGKDPEGFR